MTLRSDAALLPGVVVGGARRRLRQRPPNAQSQTFKGYEIRGQSAYGTAH